MRPTLTSLQNTRIKNLVKLRQRRQREQQDLMLIDGVRALSLAIRNDFVIKTLYFDETRPDEALLQSAQAADIDLQPVTSTVFQKIGYGDNPDGHLGVAPQPDLRLERLPIVEIPLYVVVEGLEKPGNPGAILRSADAAGVTGLIICDSVTDITNPNTIRASQGTFFTVPVAVTDTDVVLRWLHDNNLQILAATPAGANLYTDFDLRRPTAIALGAEDNGLTQAWLAEQTVRIPMVGRVDSLNVAQTATILIFEAARQRGFSSFK
jgi:TrmH family RNA methyltransferase